MLFISEMKKGGEKKRHENNNAMEKNYYFLFIFIKSLIRAKTKDSRVFAHILKYKRQK